MTDHQIDRRSFIKTTASLAAGAVAATSVGQSSASEPPVVADSLCHGPGWETLNPGYWQINDGRLRRRIKNYGDRSRATGFPFRYETQQNKAMPVEYTQLLPQGVIYRNDWKLTGAGPSPLRSHTTAMWM